MHKRRCTLLVCLLAEIDQQIAEVEDPLFEPIDSDQVQRAVAVLCELYELRTELEGSLKANEEVVSDGSRRPQCGTPSITLAPGVRPILIAELDSFKMVEVDATGLLQLTSYGEKSLVVMETVDGCLPEVNPYGSDGRSAAGHKSSL